MPQLHCLWAGLSGVEPALGDHWHAHYCILVAADAAEVAHRTDTAAELAEHDAPTDHSVARSVDEAGSAEKDGEDSYFGPSSQTFLMWSYWRDSGSCSRGSGK